MSLSAIGSSDQTSELTRLLWAQQASGTGQAGQSWQMSGAAVRPPPAIGAMGQSLSDLSELASSDPDKFKELTSGLADELRTKAEETDDEDEAAMLNEMADRFSAAAESGDVEDLRPPKPPEMEGANGQKPMMPPPPKDDSTTGNYAGEQQTSLLSSDTKDWLDNLFAKFSEQVSAALA